MKSGNPQLIARRNRRRIFVVSAALIVALLVMVGAMLRIYFSPGQDLLSSKLDKRSVMTTKLFSLRGSVFDRNGVVIAKTLPFKAVIGDPQILLDPKRRSALQPLADALDMEKARLVDILRNSPSRKFAYLKRSLNEPEVAGMRLQRFAGVSIGFNPQRYYPLRQYASHVVGFTNYRDSGQEGLELAFDDVLAGDPPVSVRTRVQGLSRGDDQRRVIDVLDQHESKPAPGKDFYAAIDYRLQSFAYQHLERAATEAHASGGAIVLIDARSGEILVMASFPAFNPNDRAQRDPRSGRLKNRALIDVFEPGSTIKPFTIAAGLVEGAFDANTVVDTSPGYIMINGKKLSDPRNYGALSVAEVLSRSSQVGIARLSQLLQSPGSESWAVLDMLRNAGMGELSIPSGGLPGEGLVALPAPRRWSKIEKVTLSFGYGLLTNLAQLARSYMVFANDGRLLPLSIARIDAPPPQAEAQQALSPRVAREVLAMLEQSVEYGTGQRAAIPGYRVAGKTGTSQKAYRGGYFDDQYVSLFVGIAPVSAPRFIAAVMLDEPRGDRYFGGELAAPLFAQVMKRALHLFQVPYDAAADAQLANLAIPND